MSNLKQKSIDAIIWNLIAKYGIQIFSLIIGVILARLLTPADFGLIGMITVFFVLAEVFINSGFGAAFIQKRNVNETDASTIFFFNIFISIFLYLILWMMAPLIASFYDQNQLVYLTRVSSLIIIINSLGLMHIVKLTKEVNFKKKAVIELVSTLISGIIGISAALNNFGVWSLVMQQLFRAFFFTIGLWLFYSWRPKIVFRISSLKSMFSFSVWILLIGITRAIFDNIYILIIGKFFPIAELGFYTKAKGYQKMLSQQPASAISVVSFPVFSKLQDDKFALKQSMKKFMQHTVFFLAPISATLIVIAKPLIFVVLTSKWMPMVPYFQLLLVMGFLFPIHLMNVQMLNAQGKSNLNFRISILKNSIRILNIIIMYRFGVIFIIYGEIAASFIGLFINGYFTKIYIKYGMFEQLKDLSKTFIISASLVVVGFLTLDLFANDFIKIVVGVLFCAGSYGLMQYVMNRYFFISNLKMFRSKFFNRKVT